MRAHRMRSIIADGLVEASSTVGPFSFSSAGGMKNHISLDGYTNALYGTET
jgi:hypothetical protein